MTDDQINARCQIIDRLSMMLEPNDFYEVFESFYDGEDDLTNGAIMKRFSDFAFMIRSEPSEFVADFFEFYTNQVKQKLKECRQ